MQMIPIIGGTQIIEMKNLMGLPDLIRAIGTESFADALIAFYGQKFDLCGLRVYDVDAGGQPCLTVGAMDRGPAALDAFTENLVLDGETIRFPLRFGGRCFAMVLVLRAPSTARVAAIAEDIEATSPHVAAALANHAQALQRQPSPHTALSSLDVIETCLSRLDEGLSPRESAVCSRIIYGMTTYGIAVNLGIGEESVSTYRKRAYRRLGIACQRELLMIYLERWQLLWSRRSVALAS